MTTIKWRLYGADGHRMKDSFGDSETYDFSDDHETRIIKVARKDVLNTNEYIEVTITANTAIDCIRELSGQVSDGLWENCRIGRSERKGEWNE